MKKYGKYETAPVSAAQKKAAQKSVMLQTYFTSLLCLVLCVVMFFGTTYAWFTSEVNNVNNEIYIGILDVELEKALPDGTWASLSELDGAVNKTNLFDRNIRWEPGYTSLETIKVVNKGDLAFRYTLAFTDGKFADKANAELEAELWKEVAKHFDVWVYDYGTNQNVAPTATSYAQIASEGSGWMFAGSLVDVLSGKAVFSGEMKEVRKQIPETTAATTETTATEPVNAGTTDGIAAEHTYTIALHMKEDADISIMGHKITMNVKLVAYQMTKEQDSFGSDQYDKMAATVEELNEALKAGGKVTLATDINLLNTNIQIPEGVTAVLDLNGHNITRAGVPGDALIENKGDLTINGTGKIAVVFTGEVDGGKAVNAISNRGVLTINGGEISNTADGTVNQIGYAIDNYNGAVLTVNGGKITASGSGYYDGIRLFCGDKDTIVTVNGGEISTIWAQNPSTNKETAVKGTVIVNGGTITTVYYENYTTAQVKNGVTVVVEPYGAGSDKTTNENKDGYILYSFVHE